MGLLWVSNSMARERFIATSLQWLGSLTFHLCRFVLKTKADLEVIHPGGRNQFVVLEAPNDDARVDADAVRKIPDRILCFEVREFSGMIGGNQEIPSPLISFMLCLRFNELVVTGIVEKYIFLSVQQDMRRFIEEGEPEPVVGLSVQRKLDQSPMRAKPTRHAADVGTRNRRHEYQGNARFPAKLPQARFGFFGG